MVSAIGAIVAVVTLTLMIVAGFFVYKVYFKGEMRIEEPVQAKNKEAEWIEEE